MKSRDVNVKTKEFPFTRRKLCSLILIIGLLCSAFFAGQAVGQSGIGNQNYPTAYNSGGPTGAYDYLIFTFENSTDTYYAAKDSFGRIVDSWTSTDAMTVAQSAYDALPQRAFRATTGDGSMRYGHIVFDGGLFLGAHGINIGPYSDVWFQGQGQHTTILKVNNTGYESLASQSQAVFNYTTSTFIGDLQNSPSWQNADLSAVLRVSDLCIDLQDEQYMNGVYVTKLSTGDFNNLRILGYYFNQTLRPWSVGAGESAPYTKGFCIADATGSNVYYTLKNVEVSGWKQGFNFGGDHINGDQLYATQCYRAFYFSGGYGWVLDSLQAFQTYMHSFYFTQNLQSSAITAVLTGAYMEGVINSGGAQIYVNANQDDPLIADNFDVTFENMHRSNHTNLLGGNYTLLHFRGSPHAEKNGVVTFASNETVTVPIASFGDLIGPPTVGFLQNANATANTYSWASTSTEITITSSSATSTDTVYYKFQFNP